ncbi:hypothetical protein GXW82_07070 [Streptacidiphilus sp. 4-A2]|nr:hypothetical protein [Streptacidiphilus sp. 4-A2]
MTAAQRGVWYGQQLDPESTKYNIAEILEISGPLDEKLFDAALRSVAQEFEAMNIEFVVQDDVPWQRAASRPAPGCPLVDLSAEPDPSAAAERYMAEDMARVDSLAAPTQTYALLRLGPELHYWYSRYHHIVMDGLSGSVVAHRIAEMYTAKMAGGDLPPVFSPICALVDDELAYCGSPDFESDRAYWTQKYADYPADWEDRGTFVERRRQRIGEEGAAASASISASAATDCTRGRRSLRRLAELRRLASASRTTWSAVVVSAVALHLSRVTGDSEVAIGLASHGRRNSMRAWSG